MAWWFGRKRKNNLSGQQTVQSNGATFECPPKLDGNPGRALTGRLELTRGAKKWTESLDVVGSLTHVLSKREHSVEPGKECVRHSASGLLLRPSLVDLQLMDNGGIRTVTTIQTHHPTLVPQGVFEYQHSAAGTLEEAISQGFDMWCQTDLPVFLDALCDKPQHCTFMDAEFPARDGKPAHVRRGVLGPAAHYRQLPVSEQEEHSFCPCCFLTRSAEVFKRLFESESFCAIRFYAMRDENGVAGADCRINGDEFEEGKVALRAYAGSWPQSGFEFRKQYVIVHSVVKHS